LWRRSVARGAPPQLDAVRSVAGEEGRRTARWRADGGRTGL